jgi:NADH-quinone oxidoreductase subunit L
LAVLSVIAGFFYTWFFSLLGKESHLHFGFLTFVATVLSVAGLVISWLIYEKGLVNPQAIAEKFGILYESAFRKFYFDDVYQKVFVSGVAFGGGKLSSLFDRKVIDGIVNLIAKITTETGNALRILQTGVVNDYISLVIAGVVITIFILWGG